MDHQTVTIPNDSTEAFTNIQQAMNHFPRQPTHNLTNKPDDNTKTEDPPASSYAPFPDNENHPTPPYIFHSAQSEYHLSDIQPATEPTLPTGDSSSEDTYSIEERETPQATEDDGSKRYWCAVNNLD
jgi:hypothetical protein